MPNFDDMSPISEPLPAIADSIESLEALIDSGATSVTQDGQTVAFDPENARKRLRELYAQREAAAGERKSRPRLFRYDLK